LHSQKIIHKCKTEQLLHLMQEPNARRAMNIISELVAAIGNGEC